MSIFAIWVTVDPTFPPNICSLYDVQNTVLTINYDKIHSKEEFLTWSHIQSFQHFWICQNSKTTNQNNLRDTFLVRRFTKLTKTSQNRSESVNLVKRRIKHGSRVSFWFVILPWQIQKSEFSKKTVYEVMREILPWNGFCQISLYTPWYITSIWVEWFERIPEC